MSETGRELDELMNAELDGVATPQESERLRILLEARPEAREEYEKLGGVIAALEELGLEEPPASLKQDILRSARTSPAPARRALGDRIGAAADWLGGVLGLRTLTTFSAGAALGVLCFALLSGHTTGRPDADTRAMTGAMLPLAGGGSYRVISSREFTLAQGRVLAEALEGRGAVAIRLTLDTPVGSEVAATWAPESWGAVSLRQEVAGNEVMLGTGRLSVRIEQPGSRQYLLNLARRGPAGSPFRIAIHSPDGYVQGELDTRALRTGS